LIKKLKEPDCEKTTQFGSFNFCARSELVEEYPRALKETLQQVQGERGNKKLKVGNGLNSLLYIDL